jgi:phosphoribosylamine-glycine ligase
VEKEQWELGRSSRRCSDRTNFKKNIHFDGAHFRRDIAAKALRQKTGG